MENLLDEADCNNRKIIKDPKIPPKKSRINYWMITTVILLFLIFLEFFLFNKDIILSRFNNNGVVNNTTDSSINTPFFSTDRLEWKTITSEKGKLTFKYPTIWPLDFEPEEKIKEDNELYDPNDDNDMLIIESIDFSEKFYRNAGGERYGWISVWKQKNINTLDDYVKYIDRERESMGRGATIKIPRPKIKYSVINGEVAVTEYQQGNLARLDSPNYDLDFILVKNGLIYRISATKSKSFMQNEELNTKIFRDILSSIKFLD